VYAQARGVAGEVNAARADVLRARASIEQRRRERAVAEVLGQRVAATQGGGPGAPQAPPGPADAEEVPLLAALEAHKARYVAAHGRLNEHKRAAGELQAALEARQAAMSAEFDAWYTHAVVAAAWPAETLAPGTAGLLPWAPPEAGGGHGPAFFQAPAWVSQPPPVVGSHGRPSSAAAPAAAVLPAPLLSAGPLAALVALAGAPLPAMAAPAPLLTASFGVAAAQPAAWQSPVPASAGGTRAASALFGPAPLPPHGQTVGSGTWGDAVRPLGGGGA
jgi:hypothetical protein